jgi:Protein of unknown function (DUF3443)
MRPYLLIAAVFASVALAACVNNTGTATIGVPLPTANTAAITVDSGPAGATGQINHLYVTVKVCAPGSQTQCASIDHVLVDTGSSGLRLVRSVLVGAAVTLSAQTDAQGNAIEECLSFVGGQTWGPVALADVTLAAERAQGLPVQVMDDTGATAPPPATCGASGTLINNVAGFGANGILGIGVLAQDCGPACVNPTTPQPVYYGCTSAGACTAENIALTSQVTNPVWKFATDNNGVIVSLPALQNANGDATVTGQLIFGIGTQTDNALPLTGLAVLGTDGNGDITTHYNGGAAALPGLFDTGTDSYQFDDPTIGVCSAGAYVGYYCPAVAPLSVFAVNTGIGTNNTSSTVNFAIADPNSFVANATAFTGLAGGGGSTRFTWGMPFFYGRKVYIGIEQRAAGGFTGPYFAY